MDYLKIVDKQGRISINKELMSLANLNNNENKVAICYKNSKQIVIRPIDQITGYKVLLLRSIDHKGRISIPHELKFKKCLVYVLNGELTIEEVD